MWKRVARGKLEPIGAFPMERCFQSISGRTFISAANLARLHPPFEPILSIITNFHFLPRRRPFLRGGSNTCLTITRLINGKTGTTCDVNDSGMFLLDNSILMKRSFLWDPRWKSLNQLTWRPAVGWIARLIESSWKRQRWFAYIEVSYGVGNLEWRSFGTELSVGCGFLCKFMFNIKLIIKLRHNNLILIVIIIY